MSKLKLYRAMLAMSVCAGAMASVAYANAKEFNVPGGDLEQALNAYTAQAGIKLAVSSDAIKGVRTKGAKGDFSADTALARILKGTGFSAERDLAGVIQVMPQTAPSRIDAEPQTRLAAATATSAASGVESVVVTSSKIKGDIQTVPIAITALSQEQLTTRQIAGGPDLVKEVPNLTFSKTNFSGYNIEIRGIGTQAISVSTDPAVAVAFNDTPFIRNHFFEQEFYDVSQVEVLRGPQGTLYGRNATAGVVNMVSAKPTDHYEAMGSVDIGNYNNRRLEGMVNIPIVGDQLDLRVAGEWTKRDGYSFNEETNQSTDGRNLWSGRVSLLIHPVERLTATVIWEHFQENDDRLRSGKQLCKRDPGPSVVDGPAGPQVPSNDTFLPTALWLNVGCLPGSLYAPSAFGTPNAGANPFVEALETFTGNIAPNTDPYAGVTQSHSLRVIDSLLAPHYHAKNDTLELNADYNITDALTLTSQTGYNKDSLYSTEDYDRFNTAPGIFLDSVYTPGVVGQDGVFCDPQLGCSNRLVGEDVSQEHAWQFSQEFRLASNFSGPLNFSVGANYMHYQTLEDYYVFFNGITMFDEGLNESFGGLPGVDVAHAPFDATWANSCGPIPADPANMDLTLFGLGCGYIDPNPISKIDGQGHNYFRSQNPYSLNSYAGFGEAYYQVTPDLKLTAGLRWTDDKKHFVEIPSWTLFAFKGYPAVCVTADPQCKNGVVDQQWKEWTGRFNASWTPKFDFTDQTLVYASYARGYKGGGANPPGVVPDIWFGIDYGSPSDTTHPLTFKPEFVNAFEVGTKNALLDGNLTLNGDVFYYDYKNYQISQIVDRTSVNLNFDATVKGAELESMWEPIPGLRLNFAGGYEATSLAKGSQAIDLMDRTDGHAGWMVVKPFMTETSNCILPTAVVNEDIAPHTFLTQALNLACQTAYTEGWDPVTNAPYVANPDPVGLPGYAGFDPTTAPNNGDGFAKDLSGNQLPNAPHFTTSLGADYTLPVSEDWAATLHGDFYWQSQSFARVYNDRPYDKLRGYSTTNLALIFNDAAGWQVMGYVKNVFNKTAITGAFLNSDDTELTTNVFTTDPRLMGVRITKNF